MSVGQTISELIRDMMFSAQVTSARDDWVNEIYTAETDPGIVKAIDDELKKLGGAQKPKQQNAHVKAFQSNQQHKSGLYQLLVNQFGVQGANNAIMLLKNPIGAVAKVVTSKNLLGAAGMSKKTLGNVAKGAGILAIVWFVLNSEQFIRRLTRMMTKKGGIFDKTFRNNQNTLQNQMRTREQQQSIRSGFTQVIFTTNAGTTNPRDAYNTYEQTVHDEIELINLRNIRSPGNVQP